MKFFSKVKKIISPVVLGIIGLYTKSFAIEISETLYGPPPEPKPVVSEVISVLLKIVAFILVPVILIVGIIVFFKKSEGTMREKIKKLLLIIFSIFLIMALISLIIGIIYLIYVLLNK